MPTEDKRSSSDDQQSAGDTTTPENRSGEGSPSNNNNANKLKWHSRTGSDCSIEDGARFEVRPSVEGPRYKLTQQTVPNKRYVVVMVGLPARGKTFIAQKLCRMLAWLGHGAYVHNVLSVYRRSFTPPRQLENSDFDFRDETSEQWTHYMKTLDHVGRSVKEFFERGGLVAFINDDFVSQRIREEIEARISKHADQTIFIEVTRDAEVNIQNDLEKILNAKEFGGGAGAGAGKKSSSVTTSEAAYEAARKKFYDRVALQKEQYTPVEATAKSYIKLITDKKRNSMLQATNVRGYLPSRIMSVMLNLGTQKQRYPIYFSRHGESVYNKEDRIGGNPPLTDKGHQDAQYLKDFIGVVVEDWKRRKQHNPDEPPPQIWTSQLERTMQTSQPAVDAFGLERLTYHHLNEIHAGVCEDLTYTEVKERYPSIDHFRSKAKYSFRYPQGESYQDIVSRLEPLILELENAEAEIIVVAHQAILRALLSYFAHKSADSCVYQTVPHRTIWRCTYSADGISSLEELSLPLEENTMPSVPSHQTHDKTYSGHLMMGSASNSELSNGSRENLNVSSSPNSNNSGGGDGGAPAAASYEVFKPMEEGSSPVKPAEKKVSS